MTTRKRVGGRVRNMNSGGRYSVFNSRSPLNSCVTRPGASPSCASVSSSQNGNKNYTYMEGSAHYYSSSGIWRLYVDIRQK